ncbi:MAG TPA: hypothetical protein VFL92_06485, partial [Sphingomonas sp.]|nr:hypothetical protein [Sphingomonas sp.]
SDYRIYEDPEPAGFPGKRLPFNHPNKHKTRWNVYILSEILNLLGFVAIPVTYCSDTGEFIERNPADLYADRCVTDIEMVATLRYVQRPKSLIVDGLKP